MNAARPIRVLVADDSALMRQVVRRVLASAPEIEVIDTARDGLDALLKVEQLQPDVVTMDVEMPKLDGLSALKLLMERFPRPVVMLSSLTAAGTEATVRALALGAVDFIAKPNGQSSAGIMQIADELVAKVKNAATTRIRKRSTGYRVPGTERDGAARTPLSTPHSALGAQLASLRSAPGIRHSAPGTSSFGRVPDRLLVIGSSTGGPRALTEVVGGLPADLGCAVTVVQHLPAGFTKSLAERLDFSSALAVSEARDGEPLQVGHALIAPGDYHMQIKHQRVALDQGPRRHGVRPSVDTTLETAAAVFGGSILAVILTGMGSDGTEGARAVKAAGGRVLAEAESTCAVYGMPRSVVEAGLADEIVPIDGMAAAIVRHLEQVRPMVARRSVHAG